MTITGIIYSYAVPAYGGPDALKFSVQSIDDTDRYTYTDVWVSEKIGTRLNHTPAGTGVNFRAKLDNGKPVKVNGII